MQDSDRICCERSLPPHFGLPISTVFVGNSNNYFYNDAAGLITSTASAARQIQFGLKIVF